jgi:AraC family transcriptional regulator of adaptative response / DNA-3-methyladenine glycosylase II
MAEILGLNVRALDRARMSRDARFDGKFFIAITSTGIYCRPICPSPHAKRRHVRYYPTAAAAAAAGYRPCLRCRPEAAPGTPAWLGTSAVVRRALRLIDEGLLDNESVEELAERLGIGARHLHRLFLQHVGAAPVAMAQTRRLHFAMRMLDETCLPITEVAFAAGFKSIRRFNSAFHQTFGRAPRDVRRQRRPTPVRDEDEVTLKLALRPPYDWEQVRDFLATRAVPGVERVDESGYVRTVVTGQGHAIISVRTVPGEDALELRVRGTEPGALLQLSSAARRVFDVAADPALIATAFQSDPLLGPLVKKSPGLRIPGVWSAFECAVRAILGQQISVAAAHTLAARLVARAGRPIHTNMTGLTHVFPTPAELARADLDGLGLTGARLTTLKSLARAVDRGELDFQGTTEQICAALTALPGIGEWTAQYVALRALGEPDAFPTADLVLRRMASTAGAVLSVRSLEARAEAWRPWRGYAAMHLWRASHGGQRNGKPHRKG